VGRSLAAGALGSGGDVGSIAMGGLLDVATSGGTIIG